uniref:Uncharacterized protein n=1 Tax=Oryza rufipogon TaxID=4529 RepID=A0A0E0Q8M3_ORYRU
MASPWCDLPSDLLGLVIARLPSPADRARFCAVCGAWHSAVRLHVASPPRLPWIALSRGPPVAMPTHAGENNAVNTVCVGSTDAWRALHRTAAAAAAGTKTKRHTFFLHNPFTATTVPLAELEDVLDDAFFKWNEVRKVIIRSSSSSCTPDGDQLVAVMTDHYNFPLILCRPGKGIWTPDSCTMPFVRVIDIAFFKDKLYLITTAEDLFAVDLADDKDGKPTVTNVERIIRQPRSPDGMIDAFRWSDDEDNGDAQEDDGDASSTNDDGEYSVDGEDHDEVLNQEGGDDDGDGEIEPVGDDDDIDDDGQQWHPTWEHRKFEQFYEQEYAIVGTRHLLESCERLHMVRREWLLPFILQTDHTRKLDVFEADMDAGTWVPVTGGLGGQAIFLSELFSKSVPAPAHGEVEEDTVYFVDTYDVWDMKSGTRRPFRRVYNIIDKDMTRPTWVFPPKLIV